MIHEFTSIFITILFAVPFVYMFVDVCKELFEQSKVYIILITNKLF